MLKKWETVILEQSEESQSIFTLTLNRPTSLNALNTQMGRELIDGLDALKYNKDIRVLVITGAGEKSFCAGADLKERRGMTNEEWKRQHDVFEQALQKIRAFPFPVIAAINGFALGGGFELALSADIRIAAEHATFGFPEVGLGIIPGLGGTQLLPRTVPVSLAKELLFRGHKIEANRAKEIGLVNHVVPIEELHDKKMEIAREISNNAPLSLMAIKQAVNNGLQTDLHTALSIELDQYYKCANSEDRQEGIKAFHEKRRPVWKGK